MNKRDELIDDETLARAGDGWRKYATPPDEIPPGFIEFGRLGGGFLQVHVDAIASYGPMQFIRQIGPYKGVAVENRDASGLACDFQGTPLRLHGDGKTEQVIVSHSIGEISRMCLAAKMRLEQFKCRT
jgi:hypothetical protein